MSKNTDLRIIRTRSMIKEAFFELMDTVGFSKITIDMLTKKAFISRNTFYLHYCDKYDLLNKLEDEVLLGIKEKAYLLPIDIAREKGVTDENFSRTALGLFEYVRENQQFFVLIMSEKGNPAFIYKFNEMLKEVLLSKITPIEITIPLNYLISIMTGVQANVIREWVKGGMKETPEQLFGILAAVFKDVPKNLFDNTKNRIF